MLRRAAETRSEFQPDIAIARAEKRLDDADCLLVGIDQWMPEDLL